MLSPHQATYFLLMMEPIAVAPLAPGLPAAVAEMYATTGLVAMDADGQERTVWNDGSGTAAPIGEVTGAGWLVFNQPPDIWIYIGAPIVMASGLYIWLRERQLSKSVVTEVAVQD